VPQTPTSAVLELDQWICVSIYLRHNRPELRYDTEDPNSVATLIADDMRTPNVAANWQNLPVDNRFVAGYPAFGGVVNGALSDI